MKPRKNSERLDSWRCPKCGAIYMTGPGRCPNACRAELLPFKSSGVRRFTALQVESKPERLQPPQPRGDNR